MKKSQRLSHPLLIQPVSYSPLVSLSNSLVWRFVSVLIMSVATLSLLYSHYSFAQDVSEGQAQAPLPTIEILIDGKALTAEVASTNQQRYMGLSFRPFLAENAGMLFAYPAERSMTFTMRNTMIPLSIAFISSDMVINEIHDMNVGPGQLFDSEQRAKYALEVNQGWFARHGIKAGASIVMR